LSLAFTSALGITAPLGSVTVPLIAPRYVCAVAENAKENSTSTTDKNRSIIFIHLTANFETHLPRLLYSSFLPFADGETASTQFTAGGNLG
jgi:hypothetical protein